MPIKIKPGASIENCGPEILRAAIAIDPIFSAHGADLVITSGSENYKHSAERSKHYSGDAIDVRSKNIPESERKSVAAKIKRKLGPDFVVIYESAGKPYEHYHIHWAPVYKN